MAFLPSTPAKPRAAVAVKRTVATPMQRPMPGNTGPLPPGMGTPRPGALVAQRATVGVGPRMPMQNQNTGPLPPGMGSPRAPMAPGQRPFAAMAEGGKAKKPAAKKAAAKKKPGKK